MKKLVLHLLPESLLSKTNPCVSYQSFQYTEGGLGGERAADGGDDFESCLESHSVTAYWRWGFCLCPPACAPASTGGLFLEVLELFLRALSQQSPCGRQSQAWLPGFGGNGLLNASVSSGKKARVEL